jgi:hypothetical protein
MASILGKNENVLISLDKARKIVIMENAIDIIFSEQHIIRFSTKDAEGVDHLVSADELQKLKNACENMGFHRMRIEK